MNIKPKIIEAINLDKIGLQIREEMLSVPPNPEMGDFSLPCFSFAKELKKSPIAIAEEICKNIKNGGIIQEAKVVNGYVNFFVNKKMLCTNVLTEILSGVDDFGRSNIGEGKTICLDFSSINLAKYMHIGHLSTTTIGNSLNQIAKFLGYHTVAINYIGDYGTPFGKMVAAFKLWGNDEDLAKTGVEYIQDLYIKFCQEADKNPELDDLARETFKKIEEKDPEVFPIYSKFIKYSIEEAEKMYALLNITFDSWRGESYYSDKLKPVVEELDKSGLLQDSQGAKVVDLSDHNLGVCLITKKDGTSLYSTRDLAAADDRYINYNFEKSIYVTDVSQKLHFAQFFKILELLNRPYAKGLVHVAYGRFSLPEGKISSRLGKQALLKDIFEYSITKTKKIMNERGNKNVDKLRVAQEVGMGAVIFSALKNEKIKDIVFNIDEALDFEGETSPYIQYTHARCCSILEKAGENNYLIDKFDFSQVDNVEAIELVKTLNNFPTTVEYAFKNYEPCYISRLLIDISKAYNKYYATNRVIEEDGVNYSRLAITKATKIVLKNGLKLLGISAIEKM